MNKQELFGNVCLERAVFYENSMWFVGFDDGALYEADWHNFKIKYRVQLPVQDENSIRVYSDLCLWKNDYLLISPMYAAKFILFRISTKKIMEVSFSCSLPEGGKNVNYRQLLLEGDNAYCWTADQKELIAFNFVSKKFHKIANWNVERMLPNEKCSFPYSVFVFKGKIMALMYNHIISMDIKNEKVTISDRLPCANALSMIINGERVYIVDDNNALWYSTNVMNTNNWIKQKELHFITSKIYIVANIGNYIVIRNSADTNIYIYDILSNNVREIRWNELDNTKKEKNMFHFEWSDSFFATVEFPDQSIYFQPSNGLEPFMLLPYQWKVHRALFDRLEGNLNMFISNLDNIKKTDSISALSGTSIYEAVTDCMRK